MSFLSIRTAMKMFLLTVTVEDVFGMRQQIPKKTSTDSGDSVLKRRRSKASPVQNECPHHLIAPSLDMTLHQLFAMAKSADLTRRKSSRSTDQMHAPTSKQKGCIPPKPITKVGDLIESSSETCSTAKTILKGLGTGLAVLKHITFHVLDNTAKAKGLLEFVKYCAEAGDTTEPALYDNDWAKDPQRTVLLACGLSIFTAIMKHKEIKDYFDDMQRQYKIKKDDSCFKKVLKTVFCCGKPCDEATAVDLLDECANVAEKLV